MTLVFYNILSSTNIFGIKKKKIKKVAALKAETTWMLSHLNLNCIKLTLTFVQSYIT